MFRHLLLIGMLAMLAGKSPAGEPFFDTAARALTLGLGVRWAAIARLIDANDAVYVAAWRGSSGDFRNILFKYDVAGNLQWQQEVMNTSTQPRLLFNDQGTWVDGRPQVLGFMLGHCNRLGTRRKHLPSCSSFRVCVGYRIKRTHN